MKYGLLFVVLLLLPVHRGDAKIPAQVKKSVVFLFSKDTANRLSPQGTAFFVLMKMNKQSDSANFGYLVTTQTALRSSNGSFLETLYVRINRKDGTSDTLIVPLSVNATTRFFPHPDTTVDLAVIPAYPDMNRYDFLYMPAGLVAPIDFFAKENIAEGDEVFYTGMLSDHIGIFKNIPVVRSGTIAQLSNEKYFWRSSYTEIFLIDAPVSDGSQGAPLFYYSTAEKDDSGRVTVPAKLMLAGIVNGRFNNTGDHRLSGIIPAYKLSELLNSPLMTEEREKEFSRLNTKERQKQ